jgi:hypothetical protein
LPRKIAAEDRGAAPAPSVNITVQDGNNGAITIAGGQKVADPVNTVGTFVLNTCQKHNAEIADAYAGTVLLRKKDDVIWLRLGLRRGPEHDYMIIAIGTEAYVRSKRVDEIIGSLNPN